MHKKTLQTAHFKLQNSYEFSEVAMNYDDDFDQSSLVPVWRQLDLQKERTFFRKYKLDIVLITLIVKVASLSLYKYLYIEYYVFLS